MTLFVVIARKNGNVHAVKAFLSRESAEKAQRAWNKRYHADPTPYCARSLQRHVRVTIHECDMKP